MRVLVRARARASVNPLLGTRVREQVLTCLARAAPTMAERRVQPPAAGTRPSFVSGSQKRALGPTKRTSHARAHSKPPATAAPSTTAIETKGALERV